MHDSFSHIFSESLIGWPLLYGRIILSHPDDCSNLLAGLYFPFCFLQSALHTAAEWSCENRQILSLLISHLLISHLAPIIRVKAKTFNGSQRLMPSDPPFPLSPSCSLSSYLYSSYLGHSPWPPSNPSNMPGSCPRVFTPTVSSIWVTLARPTQTFTSSGLPYQRSFSPDLFTVAILISHTAYVPYSYLQ